ncbi:MAG: hypothetical protein HY077_01485 [Elusimicrobia bacterium]|nr:hypothetical protein [Elusimicrobiota bacterium]
MNKIMRAHQRLVAIVLLALHVGGARAIAVTDACERSRVFYGPSMSFRAVTKTVSVWASGKKWERRAPRSLGARGSRFTTLDLEWVRTPVRTAPIVLLSATDTMLDIKSPMTGARTGWKLPTDTSPVQPSHLHSKN